MGKKYLLTIAIPDYRPSIENVELSSPVQHNASPDKNSRTTVMVSFLDVTVLTARVSEGKAIFGSRAVIEFSFGERERPARRRSN
ncbi:hypothetical protein TNCV_2036831 [Trichonephila clavipes]|nr:hypothetical protein TNCV_2036831 [Trichonephila clavipes]